MSEETIDLEYYGRKKALRIYFPWLVGSEFMISQNEKTPVNREDAQRLINDFPEIFRVYEPDELEVFMAKKEAEKKAMDLARAKAKREMEKEEAKAVAANSDGKDKQLDLATIEFETDKDGESYLCPFCDKTYKVNKGKGKTLMVTHLEKEHAEQWAAALAAPPEAE